MTPKTGWNSVSVERRGETVEIVQENFERTGLFVQVVGIANLERLIADLTKARETLK